MAGARWTSVLAVALVVSCYAAGLAGTGVEPADLAGWLAAALLGWVAPGWVLVRLLPRRLNFGLIDQLAWAMPVGLLVVLLGWWLNRLVGLGMPAWTPGIVVGGVAVAWPAARARLLRDAAPGWGRLASTAVVASLISCLGWAVAGGLAGLPASPGPTGIAYTPDAMFHVAMTGELHRTASPSYPMVAGEPLSYHWFYYAVAAQLGQGLDTSAVVLRMLPLALLLATVLMVAAIARQLCGPGVPNRLAGGLGAVLAGVVGNTQATAWVLPSGIVGRYDGDGGSLDPLRLYWQHSPTTTLGWVAAMAVVGVLHGALLHGGWRRFLLLLVAGFFAGGAKASILPVLVAGVLAVLGVALLRRNGVQARRSVGCAVALVAAYAFAAVFVYGGGSYGLHVAPGHRLADVARVVDRSWNQHGLLHSAAVVAVALGTSLLPTLPRLLGLAWLWGRRPEDPGSWLVVATVLAGYVGTHLTGHPGHSEIFFLVSAYPVGLAGSAAGLALLCTSVAGRSPPRRAVRAVTCAALLSAVGTSVVMQLAGAKPPGPGAGLWLWAAPMLGLALLLATCVALTQLCFRLRPPGSTALLAIAALLAAGVVPTVLAISSVRDAAARQESRREESTRRGLASTTVDLLAGAAVIRARSDPSDVVASNRVCFLPVRRVTADCDARDFTVAAYTGLRTEVTGWAYADRVVTASWQRPGGYVSVPFWDPRRLAAEQLLISHPTPRRVQAQWHRGVRWILADTSRSRVSAELNRYGSVEYDNGGIVVVRLRGGG